jgi:hypothetical protein
MPLGRFGKLEARREAPRRLESNDSRIWRRLAPDCQCCSSGWGWSRLRPVANPGHADHSALLGGDIVAGPVQGWQTLEVEAQKPLKANPNEGDNTRCAIGGAGLAPPAKSEGFFPIARSSSWGLICGPQTWKKFRGSVEKRWRTTISFIVSSHLYHHQQRTVLVQLKLDALARGSGHSEGVHNL